ncbi:hypothetical protein OTU49_011857 [Cherax quadricarinatus]|uniref:Smr domain-containing protein n=1 Tax=Cherax quadricarinatus TaxID=27406 RepID=A0AAW0W1P5_CHEQU
MYYWIWIIMLLLFIVVLCCCCLCRRKPKPILPTVAEPQISTVVSHGSRDYEDQVQTPWYLIPSITPSAPPRQVPQDSHLPWPLQPRQVPQHSHVQWPTTKYDELSQIESPTLHLKFGDRSVSEVFKNENGIPTLDLHHMTVQEAIQTTNSFIKGLNVHQKFKVITGRGLHSEGGIPKVKPAIESLLKQVNYEFEEVNNGGCFECKKTRQGGLPVTNHHKRVKQRLHLKQGLNKKPTGQKKSLHNQNNPRSKSQISQKTNAKNYNLPTNTPCSKTKPPKPKNYSSASRKSKKQKKHFPSKTVR